MEAEQKPLSLAAKLAIIGQEIGQVDKSGYNPQQKFNFIPYSDVAAKLRAACAKHLVQILPGIESYEQRKVTSKSGQSGFHYIVKMHFTVVNGENPADVITSQWFGESADFGDKGLTKAVTSATKYFIMRLLNVSESSDEDGDGQSPDMVAPAKKPAREKGTLGVLSLRQAMEFLSKASSQDELDRRWKAAVLKPYWKNEELIAKYNELKIKLSDEQPIAKGEVVTATRGGEDG